MGGDRGGLCFERRFISINVLRHWGEREAGTYHIRTDVALYGVGGLFYSRSTLHLSKKFAESAFAQLGGLRLAISFVALALTLVWWLTLSACLVAGFGFYALHSIC